MKYGDPRLPLRFWDKVQPEPNSGCYLWLGATDQKGYGKFWYKGKSRRTHRLVRKFRRTADHKCCMVMCCNAEHLQDISRAKNSKLKHVRLNQHKSLVGHVHLER